MSFKNITGLLLFFLLLAGLVKGQDVDIYTYYPGQLLKEDWKIRIDAFGSDGSNSDTFTNGFFTDVTGSGFIDADVKQKQLDRMDGAIGTGTLQRIGGGIFYNANRLFYYLGVEHQQILDSRLDADLVRLLMLGNKPFAGNPLEVSSSNYTNLYFNRILGGVGTQFQNEKYSHTVFLKAGLTSGQNYEEVHVEQATFFTHPDGDYLDVSITADTKIGDTVWANVFEVNGLGVSFDMNYVFRKKGKFLVSVSAQNLGSVRWSKNPYSATVDTSFRFEGVSSDTTSGNGNIPDDYSYESLRDLVFENPDDAPFTTVLPMILNLNGGVYLANKKFYTGINASFYPTLEANYNIEVFGTWNHNDRFQLTPILSYSAYNKFHAGLGAGVKITDDLFLQIGSAYLDSYFRADAPVGRGGFVRITFLN